MWRSLIGDPVRWIITILFGVSIATYLYFLVAQRGRWTTTVNHLLHLSMSVAMIVMAWRGGLNLPAVGPMIFFLLAGGWFMRVAGRRCAATGERLINCYYAVMMAAMAWMYALINGGLPGQTGHSLDRAQSASLAMNMSGMEMSAPQMSPTAAGHGWITIVNFFAALGFALIALYWPCHYFAKRRKSPLPNVVRHAGLELLYQATTAAGTALMFAVML